jgi:myo-inositol-1(or 4)-monophosphatase
MRRRIEHEHRKSKQEKEKKKERMKVKHVAFEAVQKAGTILMENIGNIREVHLKQRNDYVTNIDIEAENAIKSIIHRAFPHHGIVAEESGIEKQSAEQTWYIDPISSTRNYVHGLPHFATVMALQERGQFVFATVFDPFYKELFSAEKEQGAYLNGKRIQVSTTDTLSKAMLFTVIQTRGQGSKEQGMKLLENVFPQMGTYRRFGSLALELSYVAAGRIDGQIHTGTDIFAIPAGKLILEEAGGKVTDFAGNSWNTASQTTLATNGKIHHELLRTVQKVR